MIHLDPSDFQTFLQPAEMNPNSEKDEALARGLKSLQNTSKCGGFHVREGRSFFFIMMAMGVMRHFNISTTDC